MVDNNTSAFNYRKIEGSSNLSNHAFGKAIDINPVQNPYKKGNYISPKGAIYDTTAKGTLTGNHPITKMFLEKG